MVDFKTLIDLQITIFCLMLAGYLMTRFGVLSSDARKPLSALLINFVLPCNILFSFMICHLAVVLPAHSGQWHRRHPHGSAKNWASR